MPARKAFSGVNISIRTKIIHFATKEKVHAQRDLSIIDGKESAKQKAFSVLVDPDKVNDSHMEQLVALAVDARWIISWWGSLVISNYLDECVQYIKRNCTIPVVLFLSSPSQVSKYADALCICH